MYRGYGYQPNQAGSKFRVRIAGGRVQIPAGARRRLDLGGARYRRRYSGPSGVIPGYTRRVGMYGRFGGPRRLGRPVEQKFFDTILTMVPSGTVASTTNATGGLNVGIAQGFRAVDRIGSKIVIKSIQMKLACSMGPGATSGDMCHFFLIQDTQANGAYPVAGDVFTQIGVVSAGLHMRNIENGARFKILKHLTFKLNSDAGVAGAFDGDYQQQDLFIKCNIPISYSSTTGAINEIKSNNIFVVRGSTGAVAGFDGVARIRYQDS